MAPLEVGTNLNYVMMVQAIMLSLTVVQERSARLRDGMQMMGLLDSAFYASVFLFYALWNLLPYVIATVTEDRLRVPLFST